MLNWQDDQHFLIGGTTFRTLPEGVNAGQRRTGGADFFVAKPRWMVERYVELLDDLQPQRIFELGIFQGGSTALLAEVASPLRLVAIDRQARKNQKLEQYLSRKGLEDTVRLYGEVDQADVRRLAAIVEESFDGEPLDLVIDDCSHQYEPTRASFNELFPRVRPGGVYVIEDWPWAHNAVGVEPLDGLFPNQTALTRLVFEIVLAMPGVPGLIDEIEIDSNSVMVKRGEATVDRDSFDISACSNPRGKSLLTPA
jgi:SAM-dependent methyltransferase